MFAIELSAPLTTAQPTSEQCRFVSARAQHFFQQDSHPLGVGSRKPSDALGKLRQMFGIEWGVQLAHASLPDRRVAQFTAATAKCADFPEAEAGIR